MTRKYRPLSTLAVLIGLAVALLVVLPATQASAQVAGDDYGSVSNKDLGRGDLPFPGGTGGSGLGDPGTNADPDDFDIDSDSWSFELVDSPRDVPGGVAHRLIMLWIVTFARLSLFLGR